MEIVASDMGGLGNGSNNITSIDQIGSSDTGNDLLSEESLLIVLWIMYAVLCQAIDVFGTVTNIINIICFIKQGFKDPINVSLVGLAISDIGCLVPMIWTNLCWTPAFSSLDLPFHPGEFQYLTGCWPHITFTRVSSWITALIALERCLCITAPLQIKTIVTTRRVTIITICVFIILVSSVAPVYSVNWYENTFSPSTNRTMLRLVFSSNRERVEKISFGVNNIFVSFSAFIVITVCTTTLVVKLRSKSKWRKKSAPSIKNDNVTSKNIKAARMVVMISILFISCFVPLSIAFIAICVEPEISIDGKYRNISLCLCGLGFLLESINSSMNIFIYYHMSSKYRDTFQQLFCSSNMTINLIRSVKGFRADTN